MESLVRERGENEPKTGCETKQRQNSRSGLSRTARGELDSSESFQPDLSPCDAA